MGPLLFTRCTADVLGWAHWHTKRLLPVISHGPNISHMAYRRCIGMGPLAYAEAAASDFAWAHYLYMAHRRCTRMGPLEYIEPAADNFAWAHYFSYSAPPMHPSGPIGICFRTAWLRRWAQARLFFGSFGTLTSLCSGPIKAHISSYSVFYKLYRS
jgi:hypothetical protein